MSDREVAVDTHNRVGASANSFDRFTVDVTGKKYNGEIEEWDKSGGILGRLSARVEVLETGFKAHTKMLLGLGCMMLLMTGIEKAKDIGELLEKLRVLFN